MTPSRLLWQNYAIIGGSVITASSSQISFPVRRLRDPIRSNKWRSAAGWTVVAGFNDELDFTEGVTGDATATITAGTYATGDDMATAVQTAVNAAATDNTYTVTYSASTFKFTIARATGSETFGLEFFTGGSVQSCGLDLGFSVTSDHTGFTTYTGDLAAYQSRHYITFDLGAIFDVAAFLVLDHNAALGGTFTVQAAAAEGDLLTAPDYAAETDSLDNLDSIRALLPSPAQTFRYWALVIDDVQNDDGFSEVGIIYAGEWLELDLPARGLSKSPLDYSDVTYADQGAAWQDRRQRTRRFEYKFQILAESKIDEVDSAATSILTGGHLFFQRDPEADSGQVQYMVLAAMPNIQQNAGADRWEVSLTLQEALG